MRPLLKETRSAHCLPLGGRLRAVRRFVFHHETKNTGAKLLCFFTVLFSAQDITLLLRSPWRLMAAWQLLIISASVTL